MSTTLILIIVIVLLFGGGVGWYGNRNGAVWGYGGGLGTILVILLICYLLGLFR